MLGLLLDQMREVTLIYNKVRIQHKFINVLKISKLTGWNKLIKLVTTFSEKNLVYIKPFFK